MKIAVIGSGIAGNTLVWYLHRQHDITVFEAGDYLGGHTHTHDLDIDGRETRVDSGFIVFNERTYPQFIRMLDEIGVEKQPTEMSFSVHCERTGFEYAGSNLNSLFARRRNLVNPGFYRFLRDILRFNREAPELLQEQAPTLTLGEYLDAGEYGAAFRDYYILPMGAAIWSQDVARMLDFPAQFFVRFFCNHGLLSLNDRPQWYVVKGGSRSYVDRIYENFTGRVLLNTPVTSVRRLAKGVEIESTRGREQFEAIFFACHADQALTLLRDATPEETRVLRALPYQRNEAVLHRGNTLLPDRKRAWSSWNYRIPNQASAGATVTYHMNRLQSLNLETDICVTLNNNAAVPDGDVLATMTYDHPVFTTEGLRAQQRQSEINGPQRTFFCGAYWRYGFHEDGVVSALNAIEHFNQWCENRETKPVRRAG